MDVLLSSGRRLKGPRPVAQSACNFGVADMDGDADHLNLASGAAATSVAPKFSN